MGFRAGSFWLLVPVVLVADCAAALAAPRADKLTCSGEVSTRADGPGMTIDVDRRCVISGRNAAIVLTICANGNWCTVGKVRERDGRGAWIVTDDDRVTARQSGSRQ